MAEYIERSEAIEFTKQYTPTINGETTMQCVERSLLNVPAADVVEVVRCRDCKFAFPYNDYYYCENEDSPFTNSDWAVCPNGDDFCSYGERRCEE